MPADFLLSDSLLVVLTAVVGFLVGGIPFGYVVGRLHGVDLREEGSGNIGATNAGRVIGRRWGIAVVILDSAKGAGPVLLGRVASDLGAPTGMALTCGVLAVLGHVFTPFLGWRGGKGVATAGGAFMALHPAATGAAVLVWALVLLFDRRVALASMASAWSLPIATFFLPAPGTSAEAGSVRVVAALLAVLITFRHRSNIGRMLRSEEPRIGSFLGRRSMRREP